jgi:hypothetical protein
VPTVFKSGSLNLLGPSGLVSDLISHLVCWCSKYDKCFWIIVPFIFYRVIVLDQGKLVEYDTPEALLQNKASIFYSMAKDAGLV